MPARVRVPPSLSCVVGKYLHNDLFLKVHFVPATIKNLNFFTHLTPGTVTFGSMVICLGSGLVIALRYDPAIPFASTSELSAAIPFGDFFRAVHFHSAQIMLIALMIHLIDAFRTGRHLRQTPVRWLEMVACIPVVIVLNLSGFIFRGDLDAESAGAVSRRLLESIPLIGGVIRGFFFMPGEHPLMSLYVHHILILSLPLAILVWRHAGRWPIPPRILLPVSVLIAILALLIEAPLGPPPDSLSLKRLGPWYFVGLQYLLTLIPAWLAGQVLPGLFLLLLASPAFLRRESTVRIITVILAALTMAYGIVTVLGYIDFLRG
jgi:quinol-cytochrome oxidoreductase complex cytochrome b subunit